eukprot:TRINITY_DN5306_c0_g1_i1.p1 TRINITY_DN5306_c0_g1~~TRINITY_DN5306_c0_g1_i1.p1  ORF type:complete len:387 (+),score=50.58 TRINITY_DN5306_c0_g1_i1:41-1201(+)
MHKVHTLTEKESTKLGHNLEQHYKDAAEALKSCDALVLNTGAGWSAESGLKTYKEVSDYVKLASVLTLKEDAESFYEFWEGSMQLYNEATPHEGHTLVREWMRSVEAKHKGILFTDPVSKRNISLSLRDTTLWYTPEGIPPVEVKHVMYDSVKRKFTLPMCLTKEGHPRGFHVPRDMKGMTVACQVKELCGLCGVDVDGWEESMASLTLPAPLRVTYCVTSNVDRHFKRAGFEDDMVREIHGNAFEWQCSVPCVAKRFAHKKDRSCPFCGSAIRPAVLLFGDNAFVDDQEQESAFASWAASLPQTSRSLVILEIGAGPTVTSIRALTSQLAKSHPSATVIRINPDHPLPDGSRPRSNSLTTNPNSRKHIPILNSTLAALSAIHALM